MKRILEPELMLDIEQTLAYSNADFSSSTKLFLDYIINENNIESKQILDLGCGPGDVDIELAKLLPSISILAIDGSEQMCQLAIEKIKKADLSNRVEIKLDRLPNLDIRAEDYDLIISKDLLHHIPEPNNFWKEIVRLSREYTIVYVMDLIRPDSKEEAQRIVDSVADNEAEILKTDFYNSLLAAFTIDEIREQLSSFSLKYKIDRIGDRHFILKCHL